MLVCFPTREHGLPQSELTAGWGQHVWTPNYKLFMLVETVKNFF